MGLNHIDFLYHNVVLILNTGLQKTHSIDFIGPMYSLACSPAFVITKCSEKKYSRLYLWFGA